MKRKTAFVVLGLTIATGIFLPIGYYVVASQIDFLKKSQNLITYSIYGELSEQGAEEFPLIPEPWQERLRTNQCKYYHRDCISYRAKRELAPFELVTIERKFAQLCSEQNIESKAADYYGCMKERRKNVFIQDPRGETILVISGGDNDHEL